MKNTSIIKHQKNQTEKDERESMQNIKSFDKKGRENGMF